MYRDVEPDSNGNISIDTLAKLMAKSKLGPSLKGATHSHRDHRGVIQVEIENVKQEILW